MDAKTRVPYTLRVELLEGRFLLSGAGSGDTGALEPLLPGPPDGDHARPVRLAALADSSVAPGPKRAAQNRSDHDGDDGTPAAPSGAGATGYAPAAGRPQFPVPESAERSSDDDTAAAHLVPQVVPASVPQDRTVIVPPNPTPPPVATGPASADHPDVAARVGEVAEVTGTPGPSGTDGLCAVAAVSNSPAPATGECGRAVIDSSEPAPCGSPDASTAPADSGPFDWRGVFLDPLVGIPVRAVAELNLAGLGTETEAVLAHLTDPGPEWTASVEWAECVCLAAGVLLVGGGAYFARTAGRARPRPGVFPAPPEGAP